MNSKGEANRSVRATRRRLCDALVSLLVQKPVRDITVRELTRLARVSRGTFYFHYRDIYDLSETLEEQTLEEAIEEEKQIPVDICNHALLVGFGRVGSLLGEKLLASDIPLVVIETSRTRVDELRERGVRAVLGNAANEEIMQLAHLECAKWLILTIPNGYEAGEIVASARAKKCKIEDSIWKTKFR